MKKVKSAEELLEGINVKDFKDYYFNHSDNDVIERFQLSVTYLKRIIDYLDIHKTAEQRKQIQINTNIQKYGCAVPTQNKEIVSKINNSLKGKSHRACWKAYLDKFDNPGEAIYQRNIKTKHTKQDKYGDETSKSLGLKPLLLTVVALTCCKYLINDVSKLKNMLNN